MRAGLNYNKETSRTYDHSQLNTDGPVGRKLSGYTGDLSRGGVECSVEAIDENVDFKRFAKKLVPFISDEQLKVPPLKKISARLRASCNVNHEFGSLL